MNDQMDDIFETEIEKLVTGGAGLGRYEGMAAFVPLTAPGDRVRARVLQRKRGFVEAELVELLGRGPERRQPLCPHFGRCGGCDWQHLLDVTQRQAKAAVVADCFRRLGGLDVREILEGPEAVGPPFGYRNKIRLIASPTGPYGLMRRGSHEVVPIETCPQMPDAFNTTILPWIRTLPPQEQLVVRTDGQGHWLVLLYGHPGRLRLLKQVLGDHPENEPPFPGCSGVLFNNLPLWGRDYLVVPVAGKKYRVGPHSFFQTNLAVTEAIVRTVRSWLEASRQPGGLLVDLYCGVGVFSLALADRFGRILAVDADENAVRDALNNVARDRAARDRIEVRQGRSGRFLSDPAVVREPGWAEACCLADPPRKGLGEETRKALAGLRPRDVLCLSCDPATLARDAAALVHAGYRPERLHLFDMFPQTAHVEALLHLRRAPTV
jgi:23S rRNA (uracil1939-C5)-methyltransferase